MNFLILVKKLYAFIRSVFFCVRYLPFRQAIRVPIQICGRVKVEHLRRGQIIFEGRIKCYRVLIGGGGSPALQSFITTIWMDKSAKLVIKGKATISQGTTIRVDENATMTLGDKFYCNNNNYLRAESDISFGDDCIMGWDNILNTTDGHCTWMPDGSLGKLSGSIVIGNHVWITTRCIIGKAVVIPNGCIVAQGAVVTRTFTTPNCLLGGVPAKIVKVGIRWEK